MNIVRYNIGGANPTAADEYRTGAALPCLRLPDGSYNRCVVMNIIDQIYLNLSTCLARPAM
jgi:hypothetical protein